MKVRKAKKEKFQEERASREKSVKDRGETEGLVR